MDMQPQYPFGIAVHKTTKGGNDLGLALINPVIGRLLCGTLLAGFALLGNVANARNCTPDEKTEADKKLWLNKRDATAAIDRHLPWAPPSLPPPMATLRSWPSATTCSATTWSCGCLYGRRTA